MCSLVVRPKFLEQRGVVQVLVLHYFLWALDVGRVKAW
jgi:hypothetical protein